MRARRTSLDPTSAPSGAQERRETRWERVDRALATQGLRADWEQPGDVWSAMSASAQGGMCDRESAIRQVADYVLATSAKNLRRLVGDTSRQQLRALVQEGRLDDRFAKLYCSMSRDIVLLRLVHVESNAIAGESEVVIESQPFVKATKTKMEITICSDGDSWFPTRRRGRQLSDGARRMLKRNIRDTTRSSRREERGREPSENTPPKRLRPSTKQWRIEEARTADGSAAPEGSRPEQKRPEIQALEWMEADKWSSTPGGRTNLAIFTQLYDAEVRRRSGKGLGKHGEGITSPITETVPINEGQAGLTSEGERPSHQQPDLMEGIRFVTPTNVAMEEKNVGEAAGWPREPGDDLETPYWALGCVQSLVEAIPGTTVYDPFYSTGSVARGWSKLGVDCLHEKRDFFDATTRPNLAPGSGYLLVSQPPKSILEKLLKGDLRTIQRWAILVPLTFLHTRCKLLNSVGWLSVIHILDHVDLSMGGSKVSRIRMVWLIKGIKLPHQHLYTRQGHGFWPLGQTTVYTRPGLRDSVRSLWEEGEGEDNSTSPATAVLVDDNMESFEKEMTRLVRLTEESLAKADEGKASPWSGLLAKKMEEARPAMHECMPTKLARKVIDTLGRTASKRESETGPLLRVCSAITRGKAVHLFPDVIRALRGLFDQKDNRDEIVSVCVEVLLNEYATRKAVRRCRGCISSFISKDRIATTDALVRALVEKRKALGEATRKICDVISTWVDPYGEIPEVSGVAREHIDEVRQQLMQPDDPSMGCQTWTPVGDHEESDGEGPNEVISWNVDGLRSNGVLASVLEVLKERKPRVLLLWEVKCDSGSLLSFSRDLRGELSRSGYHHVSHFWCTIPRQGTGYSGCMVISREEPESLQAGLGVKRLDKEARFVTVRYGDMTVVGSYSPCCSPSRDGLTHRRTEFETELRRHLKRELSQQPRTILIGDLNVVPELHDVDTSDMKEERKAVTLRCQALERRHYKTTITECELVDAYRETHPNPHPSDATWHRRTKTREFPKWSRIDIAAYPKELRHEILTCDTLPHEGSDHKPLSVTLAKSSRMMTDPIASTASSSGVEEKESEAGQATAEIASAALSSGVEETERKESLTTKIASTTSSCGVEETGVAKTSRTAGKVEMEPPIPQDYGSNCEDILASCERAMDEYTANLKPRRDEMEEECIGHRGPTEFVGSVREFGCTRRKMENFLDGLGQTMESVVPVVKHRFQGSFTAQCLYDTGACSKMMSRHFAETAGLQYLDTGGRAPTFKYAGGQLGRPRGLVHASWEIEEGRMDEGFFWVVDNMPYDVIFGSAYFGDRGAEIKYGEESGSANRITLSRAADGGGPCEVHFETVVYDTPVEAAVRLYASTDVLIEPGHHVVVPVAPSKRNRGGVDGTWGTVWDNKSNETCTTARGCMTMKRGSNWVQAANPSSAPMLVRRGSCVAFLLPQDKDAYHHIDYDLDVEERVQLRCRRAADEELARTNDTSDDAPLTDITFETETDKNEFEELKERLLKVIRDQRHQWANPDPTTPRPRRVPPETREEIVAGVSQTGCTCNREICAQCINKSCAQITCLAQEETASRFEKSTPADEAFKEEPLKGVTFGPRLDKPEFEGLKERLLRAIWDKRHLWEKPNFTGKGPPHDVRCKIDLTGNFTYRGRPRNVSPQVREEIKKQVEEQRKMGIIEPSTSPYASTILLVPKADGTSRFCINYKPLNALTKKDGYLMPRVDESLASLRGSKYFTSMDLASAFWQIPMDEGSKELTAFVEPGGTWQYRNMPFGLINGPATFSRFIDKVLAGLKWRTCLIYMDDVLVHTATLEEHVEALEEIFDRIDEYGLKFKPKKCFVCVDKVQFLGHVVGEGGISADPSKVKAIKEMPFPRSKEKMKSALGLFAYYRKFVKSFSKISQPILDELKSDAPLPKTQEGEAKWSEPVRNAFEELRSKLTATPILAHPNWSRPFEVHTDACKDGLGAVLVQRDENGKERVVCYASRSLTAPESKYNVHEWECLAILWSTSLWYSMYLYGKKFKVVTDNEAIKWLLNSEHTSSRLQKWVISMQDLDFDTVHRKGKSHGNADGLSRNPLTSTQPYGVEPPEPLTGVKPPVQCYVGVAPDERRRDSEFECAECSTTSQRSCCQAESVEEFGAHCKGTERASLRKRDYLPSAMAAAYFPDGDAQAWDIGEWAKYQKEDEFCSGVMKAIAKDEDARDTKELNMARNFTMERGLLMRRRKRGKVEANGDTPDLSKGSLPDNASRAPRKPEQTRNELAVVVPDNLKAFILWRHHGLPLSGHNGRKKVYSAVSARFWWKGMYQSVRRWIRGCTKCSRRKLTRPRRAGTPKMILSGYPFHIVSIDLVGPMPETPSGNKYVLTMQDSFTRWPIAVPMPSTDSEAVAGALFRHLLTVHGCPTKILSDRGANLISQAVQAMCSRWNIRKIQTSGYQPQSVPVERFHRYLNHAMTMLHGSFGMTWDEYIDAAVFTYRTAVNETTGFSPYRLLYLREPQMPDDLILGTTTDSYDRPREMVDKTATQIARMYKHVYDRQLAKAENNAMLRAEHSVKTTFFPGQLVFYYQENVFEQPLDAEVEESSQRVPNRWRFQWTGPHVVIKRMGGRKANLYSIRHNVTAETIEANVNRLALHVPWDEEHECTSLDPFAGEKPSRRHWSTDGKAVIGSLIVVRLSDDDFPVGVGKMLARDPETGNLRFQWVWNTSNNLKGVLRLGWFHKKEHHVLYKNKLTKREQEQYEPYTELEDDVKNEHVLVHGFRLTLAGKLPLAILRLISDDESVDWEIAPRGQ